MQAHYFSETEKCSEVHQAYYENNMTPIYETILNNEDPTNGNFGIHIDTITSDEPEGVHYENIHSWETKCCHNSSTKIDTVSNVAYIMSSEIPMQNNDSYRAVYTQYHQMSSP